MEWFIIALLAAVLNALKNIATKKVSFNSDQYTVAWASNLLSLPFLFGALFLSGIPQVDNRFWILVLAMMPFEIVVNLLFFKAIKDSALSEAIPFVSFLPLFVALGAFFILKEQLSPILIVALVLLSLGAYIMNIEKETWRDILAPFRILFTNTGSILIIIVTIIWGLLYPLGKLATEYSSAYFFPTVYFTLSTILFTPIFLLKSKNGLQSIKKQAINYGLVGLLTGLFLITTWVSLSLGPMAGVNALTELGIPLTVIFAGTFLKEKGLKKRLVATSVMFLGALLIILKS